MENEETNKQAPKEASVETPNLVISANEAATRLQAENDRMEKNIKQLQEIQAFQTLGGRTEGKPQEQKPVEETDGQYADRALRGNIEVNK